MERKDARLDPEAVLAHMDWVRGLAGRLVADPGLADDVVQETWLVAMRRGPSERSSLRAWLASVTRRAVLQEKRRASIRRGHEVRARRGEPEPSSAELVERASVQNLVVGAVLALDEPYRETVLLRFFEGLTPKAIAERGAIPVSTVKTRLARGLELLRARLDRSFGGDGRGWIRALAPLVPRSVWKGALAGGSWMVAMKTSVGVAAAAVVLVLGARELMRPAAGERGKERRPVELALRDPEPPVAEPTAPTASAAEPRTALSTEKLAKEGGLRVIVVDGATGERIPGATVRYGPANLVREAGRVIASFGCPDIEATLLELGSDAVCDTKGEWVAPRSDRAAVFCARAGNLWAWSPRPEGDELHLELIPDRTLTVEVVGLDGSSRGGVPVEIQATRAEGGGKTIQGRTGEHGRFVLHHLDSALPDLREGYRLNVELAVPTASAVNWTADPSEVSEVPVRLVLPETGSLTVNLRDAGGAGVAASVSVLPLARQGGDPRRRVSGRRSTLYAEEGSATFPFVAVGTDFLVSPYTDRRVDPEPRVIHGPSNPGETVSCTLEAGAPYAVLTVRVVGPDGELPGGTAISGEVRIEKEESTLPLPYRSFVRGEGKVEITVESVAQIARLRSLLLQTEAVPRLAAEIPLHLRSGESLDLGKVVLEPAPLIARGHVVDVEGKTIYWATARLRRKVFYDNGNRFVWNAANEFMTQTGKDGLFEMVGTLPPGEYELYATHSGYIDARAQALHVGSGGLVLVLEKEGRIGGTVRLDPGIDPRWLRVFAEPKEGESRFSWSGEDYVPNDRVLTDGSFLVVNLPAGPAEVRFFLPGQDAPLAVVQDVVVSPGEETRDPRLQQIDLRGLVHRIEILAVDRSGQPIASGHVAFDLGEEGAPHVLLVEGKALLLTTSRIVDATVFAPGYRIEHLTGVSGPLKISMAEGEPVRIRLPAGFELPGEGVELRAALVPAELRMRLYQENIASADGGAQMQWVQWSVGAARSFDESLELDLASPGDGPMKVLWGLSVVSKNPRSSPLSLPVALSEEIDVSSGGEVELAPDPDEYARELQRIRDMRLAGRL